MFIGFFFLFLRCQDGSTFSYSDNNPSYVVGMEITENRPKDLGTGSYTIFPKFSRGLKLDETTGIITGTPTEEYEGEFTVTFTDTTTQSTKVSVLRIIVWDKPTSLNCGFTSIIVSTSLSDTYTCKTDKKVSGFTVEEGITGVSITNDGILVFKSFSKIGENVITITANNIAGNYSKSYTVTISQGSEAKNEVKMTLYTTTYLACVSTEDQIKKAIRKTEEYTLTQSDFDNNLPYGIQFKFSSFQYGAYVVEGYVNFDTVGEYKIYDDIDGISQIWLDNKLIIDLTDEVHKASQGQYVLVNYNVENTGYVKIKVMGFLGYVITCGSGSGKIDFKYIKPGSKIQEFFKIYQMEINYLPVIGLSFDSDVTHQPVGSAINIPFHFEKGTATSCTSDIPLPTGLEFDYKNNAIIGRVNTASDEVLYTITCSNEYSVTNEAKITIAITDSYVKGLIGYYMKPNDFDINKEYSSTSENVETEFIKIDKNITHEVDTSNTPWEGLNTDFVKNFAVFWTGYIKIETKDYINFELCTSGGRGWIYIDDSLKTTSYSTGGCAYDFMNLDVGYHSIRISYSAGAEAREFIFKESNQKYDLMQMFYYVPNNKFEYTYNQATYLTDVSISGNAPVLSGGISVKSYEAINTLPLGLSVDPASGLITGKPTTKQEKKGYQITATLSDGSKIATTVYIIINEMVKPQGIFLTDISSSSTSSDKLTTLTMKLGKEYVYSIGVETGSALVFIVDNPPKGCEYDLSFKLICIPSEEGESNFTIRAVAIDGSNTPEIIKVNNTAICKDGKKYHTYSLDHVDYFQYITYSITDVATGNELVPSTRFRVSQGYTYNEFDTDGTYGGACQIPGEMTVSLQTTYSTPHDVYMKVYADGMIVMDWKVKDEYSKTYTKQINTDPVLPQLIYPETDINIYINQKVSIVPNQNKTGVEYCLISPNILPSGIEFISSDCSFSGVTTEGFDRINYTITATNILGSTDFFISMKVSNLTYSEGCELEKKSFIKILIIPDRNFVENMEISISQKDGANVLNWNGKGMTESKYEYEYCVSQGYYTSSRKDISTDLLGWGSGFVELYLYNTPIGRYSVLKGNQGSSQDHYLSYVYGSSDEWSYSVNYENNWNSNSIAIDTWSKSKLSELSKVANGDIMYLRQIITFLDQERYSSFYVRLSHRSGVIFYINGKQYYVSENMNGNICSSAFNDVRDIEFILPVSLLEEEKTSLAIEIHKCQNENNNDNFPEIKFYMVELEGDNKEDCTVLNLYQSEVVPSSANAGFDMVQGSIWQAYTGTSATMNFNQNTFMYFNQFSIQMNNSTENGVKKVQLDGIERNDTTSSLKLLSVFDDISYSKNTDKAVYPDYDIKSSYKSVKVTISETNPTGSLANIRDIGFHLCAVRYCPENTQYGLPTAVSGTIVNITCINPADGVKEFICPNERSPKWRLNHDSPCKEAPVLIYKENEVNFTAGNAIEEKLFEVDGYDITYEMQTEIPGITIDKKTGVIRGTPYEAKEYNCIFLAKNTFNPSGLVIQVNIKILLPLVPVVMWINDTVSITAGVEFKSTQICFVIGDGLTITHINLPSGIKFDEKTQSISGTTKQTGEIEATFTFKTSIEEISRTIRMILLQPDYPIVLSSTPTFTIYYGETYPNGDAYIQPLECLGRDLVYSNEGNLPKDLTIDSKSGELKGKVSETQSSTTISVEFICRNANNSAKVTTTFTVSEPSYPILISSESLIEIIVGVEYKDIKSFEISGKATRYTITPNTLPNGLKFNENAGLFSGYVTKETAALNYKMTIIGGGKSVEFEFTIHFTKSADPQVPESTVVESHSFSAGEVISGFQLFEVIGDNIQIEVTPKLPEGIIFNSQSGVIYGNSLETVELREYTFVVKNPPSTNTKTIKVKLSFSSISCPADSGFPTTSAVSGGKDVYIKCSGGKSGYKIRTCYLIDDDPKWKWSAVRDDCSSSAGTIAAIVVGVFGFLVLIGCFILFCILRSGILTKRAVSASMQKRIMDDKKTVIDNKVRV